MTVNPSRQFKKGLRGIEGGKQVKGRKRHWIVDVTGHIYAALVGSAGEHDCVAGQRLLQKLLATRETNRLQKIIGDGAYSGDLQIWFHTVTRGQKRLQITQKPKETKGFQVLPKRWIVERSFAWTLFTRRLNRDYEHNPKNSLAYLLLSDIVRMMKKLIKV